MNAMVVITTVGNEEEGNRIARELVARRQAACVNMIPGVKSFYRWEGKICHDSEYMLLVKTTSDELADVTETIQEVHSYDLPEVIAFEVGGGDPAFLDWIVQSLDKDVSMDDEIEFAAVD